MSDPDLEACAICGAARAGASRCPQCGAVGQVQGWRILSQLSQRPNGRTYLASDAAGSKAVLKELLFGQMPDADQLAAFEGEAAILQELSGPRFPRFLGSFRDGQAMNARLYFAQSCFEGPTLAERVRRRAFTEQEAIALAREVLTLLASLHERVRPLVHGDVTPDKLIESKEGGWALVGFGAARHAGTAMVGRVGGTPGYVSPEQALGRVEPCSDLYALGATLVHALSGQEPKDLVAPNLRLDFANAIRVTPETHRFITRLVARQPAGRFPSTSAALAAAQGLGAVAAEQAAALEVLTRAREVTPAQGLWEAIPQAWKLWGGIGAVVFLGVCGVARVIEGSNRDLDRIAQQAEAHRRAAAPQPKPAPRAPPPPPQPSQPEMPPPRHPDEVLLDRASALLQSRRFDESLEVATAIAERHGTHLALGRRAALAQARAQLALRRTTEALSTLGAVAASGGGDAEVHEARWLRADTLLRMGSVDLAKPDVEALAAHPNVHRTDAVLLRAELLAKAGRRDEAVEGLQQFLTTLDRGDPAWDRVARLASELGAPAQ